MREFSETRNRLEWLGLVAAGMAHDLNNELTLVLNHLDQLRHPDPHLSSARAATARCADLTSSLLSCCTGGGPGRKTLDLTTFLRQYAEHLTLPAGVRLQFEPGPEFNPVQADSQALRRILDNLVGNACDAMPEGGEISLSAAAGILTVSDTGPGVPVLIAGKAFQPFFTTRGMKGTGLGLTIVKELMRQQGGSVTLRSQPGRGATFELRFLP